MRLYLHPYAYREAISDQHEYPDLPHNAIHTSPEVLPKYEVPR